MSLISNAEGKKAFPRNAVFLKKADKLGEKNVVTGNTASRQISVVIFQVEISVKPQIGVDIQAVVKPLIAWVASGHGIALFFQIPGVGICGGAEGAERRKSRYESPLGIHGTSSKNVYKQIPRIAFRLQLVVGLINRVGKARHVKLGKVVVSLQHYRNDINLFILRNVGLRPGRQHGLGPVPIVVFRRFVNGI
ncbi:hypothetical protein SDC9_97548 [bioreactor metagenome]|uniref:Uncharacterized protein n=1 Tax=bioreactor metagenome TaxID=1076179 RepID=A0A645AC82_9ZZZZ